MTVEERSIAIVTGAGTGVGRATALALASRGLQVVCVGRRESQLELTSQLLNGRGLALSADIATDAGVALVTEAVAGLSVKALVHAAAIEGIVSLAETSRATFDQLVATNLAGPFFLTKALVSSLAEGAGIVFVSSVSAMHGRDRHSAYSATKAGLLGLTTNLAVELAPRIRVNCVVPGAVDTPMFANAVAQYFESMDQGEAEKVGAAEMTRVLLRRIGDPAEVASAIVYLALDASYSTGSIVTVDGGFSAR